MNDDQKYSKELTEAMTCSFILILAYLKKINKPAFDNINKKYFVKHFNSPFFNAEYNPDRQYYRLKRQDDFLSVKDYLNYLEHIEDHETVRHDNQISINFGVLATLSSLSLTRAYISRVCSSPLILFMESPDNVKDEIKNIFTAWNNDDYPHFKPFPYGIQPTGDPLFIGVLSFVFGHEVGHHLIKDFPQIYDRKLKDIREIMDDLFRAGSHKSLHPGHVEIINNLIKNSGNPEHYLLRWSIELCSDIIAYEMCENLFEYDNEKKMRQTDIGFNQQSNRLISAWGLSYSYLMQRLTEQYCIINDIEIPLSHPPSAFRIVILEIYLNKHNIYWQNNFYNTKEGKHIKMTIASIDKILEEII